MITKLGYFINLFIRSCIYNFVGHFFVIEICLTIIERQSSVNTDSCASVGVSGVITDTGILPITYNLRHCRSYTSNIGTATDIATSVGSRRAEDVKRIVLVPLGFEKE